MSYYPNPRKGTETIRHRSDQNLNLGRRITRIPVRGLKLKETIVRTPIILRRRITQIPVRGLKLFTKSSIAFREHPSYYPNPRS